VEIKTQIERSVGFLCLHGAEMREALAVVVVVVVVDVVVLL
jgi:hypothetical protein